MHDGRASLIPKRPGNRVKAHRRDALSLAKLLRAGQLTAPCVAMANVLGADDPDLHGKLGHVLAADPALKIQLYGKPVRPGRKVGHVTALGDDMASARDRATRAARYLATGSEEP